MHHSVGMKYNQTRRLKRYRIGKSAAKSRIGKGSTTIAKASTQQAIGCGNGELVCNASRQLVVMHESNPFITTTTV